MAANAKHENDTPDAPDTTSLENIDWEAVEAIDPDLAALLRLSQEQNAELRQAISKGASEKKAREPQTLAARVNRALTTEPKGLNKFGVLVANTGQSPIGDIDNAPILDGLRRAIEECGVTVPKDLELVMGEHFLSYALLVYNLGETRAHQPKKGEKTTEPQNGAATAGEREDDETEDDD